MVESASGFWDKINQQAGEVQKEVFNDVCNATGNKFIADMASLLFKYACFFASLAATVVAVTLATIGAPIAEIFVKALATIRNTPSDSINGLIAATVGEFFGAEFDTSNLSAVPGQQTNLANMQAIGADIYELLENEFVPGGELTEDQGVKAAEAFVGFATNFAVRTAFVGLLGEFETLGKIEAFRELGEDIAANLGLGRLIRRALQPLIQIAIQTPLTWSLNNKYRPKRLDEKQLYTAFQSGAYDEGDFHDALAEMGYRDGDVDVFLKDISTKNGVDELFALVRYQIIGQDTATQRLLEVGYNADSALAAFKAADLKRADAWVKQYVDHHIKAYTQGQIDFTALDNFLQLAPIGPIERTWIEAAADVTVKIPHRVLSLATEELAVEDNVITISEFEQYLTQVGFNPNDAFTLVQLTLLKQAAKAATAAKKAAKGKTTA